MMERARVAVHSWLRLVREEPQLLVQCVGLLAGDEEVALVAELRHRARDGVVQAAVERAEFIGLDRCAGFDREVGDRLAQVAVVVDHFLHGEAVLLQFLAVPGRRVAHLRQLRLAATGWTRDLAAEHRGRGLLHHHRLDQLV